MRRAALGLALLAIAVGAAEASVFDRFAGAPARRKTPDVERPRPIDFNGARLWLATGRLAMTPAQVRARYLTPEESAAGGGDEGSAVTFDGPRARFVSWEPDGRGGTRLFTLEAEPGALAGVFNPPSEKACRGGADVAVPSGAACVLVLREAGMPYRARVYESRRGAAQVAAELRAAMRPRGWLEPAPLRFVRGNAEVVYELDTDETGTLEVAVLESGTP